MKICHYCGLPQKLSRDHIVPRARGGPGTADNIVLACFPCNFEKADAVSTCTCDKCTLARERYEPKTVAEVRAKRNRRKPHKVLIPVCQVTGAVWCNCQWCSQFNR